MVVAGPHVPGAGCISACVPRPAWPARGHRGPYTLCSQLITPIRAMAGHAADAGNTMPQPAGRYHLGRRARSSTGEAARGTRKLAMCQVQPAAEDRAPAERSSVLKRTAWIVMHGRVAAAHAGKAVPRGPDARCRSMAHSSFGGRHELNTMYSLNRLERVVDGGCARRCRQTGCRPGRG